jgi:hypothetical protein
MFSALFFREIGALLIDAGSDIQHVVLTRARHDVVHQEGENVMSHYDD